MARPSRLTTEVEQRILNALRADSYASTAASYAGIHPATYYRWLERDDPSGRRRADPPYRKFAERVEQGCAEPRSVTSCGSARQPRTTGEPPAGACRTANPSAGAAAHTNARTLLSEPGSPIGRLRNAFGSP